MSGVTGDEEKSSAEFDFALAGHFNSGPSKSPAVLLTQNLRRIRNELESIQPGELASQFVSARPSDVAQPDHLTRTADDPVVDYNVIDPKRPPSILPLDLTPDDVILGFGNGQARVEESEHEADASPNGIGAVGQADDPFALVNERDEPTAEVKIGDSLPRGDVRSAPHAFEVPPLPLSDELRANGSGSTDFVNDVPQMPPAANRIEIFSGIVHQPRSQPNRSDTAEKPQIVDQKVDLPESPSDADGPDTVELEPEGRTTTFDSRFLLLLVGLFTLITFVILCIWLVINTESTSDPNRSTETAIVDDFVPPESLVVAPAVIQAEDYDAAGPGISFNDSDDSNSGGVYRSDGVDIAAMPGQGLKLVVVDTTEGEWLVYSFTVTESGVFAISTGVSASVDEPGSLNVSVDGNRVGTFYAEKSSSEFDFTKQVIGEVQLEPGEHTLRIGWSGNAGVSVDWLEIGRG